MFEFNFNLIRVINRIRFIFLYINGKNVELCFVCRSLGIKC